MTHFTRRDFLRKLTAGGATLASYWLLSACRGGQTVVPAAPLSPTSTQSPSPTAIPPSPTAAADQAGLPTPGSQPESAPTATTAEPGPPTAAPSVQLPDMVVARGDQPEELVRQALSAIGGIRRFVQPGHDVIVKPNICVAYHTYEYAATTNPWVVGSLVKLCLEAGARRVRVLDYPFGGTAEEAYARSGIQEQVQAAGGTMEIMARFKYVNTDIPQGLDLRQVDIYEDVLSADVLIDVPIAKHHSLARLTLGMKNLMGIINNRPAIHRNLGQRLADLSSRIQPTLTVVDAVRILMDHGPTGGNLDDVKQLNTLIVSPDIMAADSYAATLFGMQPSDLSYIQAGTAMGLGRSDLASLKIKEITVGG
jgi:uncharacterized protein (DUF362 family)